MPVFSNPAYENHETVQAFHDTETGLRGFIAVHSTALGPSFGGCRLWAYDSDDDALTDALRLSQGMSYKNALAGIPFGGGKAVIMATPGVAKSAEMFKAFGRAVDSLGGRYITAEDVGVSVEDMRSVAITTRHGKRPRRKSGTGRRRSLAENRLWRVPGHSRRGGESARAQRS